MMQVHIQNDGPVTIEIESPVPTPAPHTTPNAKTDSSNSSTWIKLVKLRQIFRESIYFYFMLYWLDYDGI